MYKGFITYITFILTFFICWNCNDRNRKVHYNKRPITHLYKKSISGKSAKANKIEEFINYLYNQNNIFSKEGCFTRGAFVFEDNDSNLFKSIYNNREKLNSIMKNIICKPKTGTVNDISWKKTHRKFIENRNIESTYDAKEQRWIPIVSTEGKICFKQYEYELPNGVDVNCTDSCDLKTSLGREKKKNMIFYHFRSKMNKKRYTYVKLESQRALHWEHAKNAFWVYVLNKHTKSPFNTCRETEQINEETLERNRNILNCLDIKDINCANSSFNDYNKILYIIFLHF